MSENWSPRTRLVHGGARRSQYGETSEAIFLTQGFVYPDAATAEARFIASGPDEFIYARYGNPTVGMFEERMAALEGAEDAFATASGMAAVHGALFASSRPATTWSRRGRSSAPASTSSRPCCRASASRSASSTAPTSASGGRDPPGTGGLPRDDLEPDARDHRPRRGRRAGPRGRRAGGRRQRLRHADLPALPRRSAPTW